MCIYILYIHMYIYIHLCYLCYGVATISRMLKNIGLFCKRALQKRPVFCKETCIFKHPTNRSHPILRIVHVSIQVFMYIHYVHVFIHLFMCKHSCIYVHTSCKCILLFIYVHTYHK